MTHHTSVSAIAKQLGRSPSSIYREINRAGSRHEYDPSAAHEAALSRRRESAKANKRTPWVRATVESLLAMELSPEQIANRMVIEGAKERVSHEWIYRYVLWVKRRGGRLWTHLRQSRRCYRKRYGSHARGSIIKNRHSISERPEIVEKRLRIGDWQGDTVHGRNASLVTLVDRATGFTSAKKVVRRTRRAVTGQINKMLKDVDAHTLTLDNGPEFAGHESIAKKCGIDVYFADPYSSFPAAPATRYKREYERID